MWYRVKYTKKRGAAGYVQGRQPAGWSCAVANLAVGVQDHGGYSRQLECLLRKSIMAG